MNVSSGWLTLAGCKHQIVDFGCEDPNAIFGGGNDFLGGGTITSYDELETLRNRTFYGHDIDITVSSRNLSRNEIPAEQDPWNGVLPY